MNVIGFQELYSRVNKPTLRGMCGSGWVGLRGFFDPTHHGGSKKIQPNLTHHISPTQPTWIGLGQVKLMG